jgi:hypothetical protein
MMTTTTRPPEKTAATAAAPAAPAAARRTAPAPANTATSETGFGFVPSSEALAVARRFAVNENWSTTAKVGSFMRLIEAEVEVEVGYSFFLLNSLHNFKWSILNSSLFF